MSDETIGSMVFGLRTLSDKLRHYASISDFAGIAPDLEKAADALDVQHLTLDDIEALRLRGPITNEIRAGLGWAEAFEAILTALRNKS